MLNTKRKFSSVGWSKQWYRFYALNSKLRPVTRTIELSDELRERLERHADEDESLEEFIEELVAIYEHEGRFLDEGL